MPEGAAAAEDGGAAAAEGQRWRLDVAYDGSGFKGFAAQPGETTVAGALADALGRVARLDEPPTLVCAGRTDSGVHARGQVVHVDLPAALPLGRSDLARALNRQLAPAVVVTAAVPVAATFDARRAALARHYRYLVHEAAVPDPLLAPTAWHVPGPLDLRAMVAATDPIVGEHDFRAFCRRPQGTTAAEPIVRVVTAARWAEATLPDGATGRLLRFDISATSFCHQMVRSIVAALVEVGEGRGNVATLVSQLASGTRAGAAKPAPAHGLCLVAVDYPAG